MKFNNPTQEIKSLTKRFRFISSRLRLYKRANHPVRFFMLSLWPKLASWHESRQLMTTRFVENSHRLSWNHKEDVWKALSSEFYIPSTLDGVLDHIDDLIFPAMKAGARDAFLSSDAIPDSFDPGASREPVKGDRPPIVSHSGLIRIIFELDMKHVLLKAREDWTSLDPVLFRQILQRVQNKFFEAASRAVLAQQFDLETKNPRDSKLSRYENALRDTAILVYALAARLTFLQLPAAAEPRSGNSPIHENSKGRDETRVNLRIKAPHLPLILEPRP